jgi:hypothetical protein
MRVRGAAERFAPDSPAFPVQRATEFPACSAWSVLLLSAAQIVPDARIRSPFPIAP